MKVVLLILLASLSCFSAGTAAFVSKDIVTQGSWSGVYGADGYNVATESSSYPGYASVSVTGGTTLHAMTADVRGLQIPGDLGNRTTGIYFTNQTTTAGITPIVIDVTITGGPKMFSAYFWPGAVDDSPRNNVQIRDGDTDAALGVWDISSYGTTPIWLSWNITGHVKLFVYKVTAVNGGRLSGFFFDPAGTAAAIPAFGVYQATDTTTQGDWLGVYGSAGHIVAASGLAMACDTNSIPAFVTAVNFSNPVQFGTTSAKDLQKSSDGMTRCGQYWWGSLSNFAQYTIAGGRSDITSYWYTDDTNTMVMKVYLLDYTTNTVLNEQTLTGLQTTPVYITWKVGGHVMIRADITTTGGSSNPRTSSAMFFEGLTSNPVRRRGGFIR